MEKESDVYAAFLDDRKAFNCVWVDGLFRGSVCLCMNANAYQVYFHYHSYMYVCSDLIFEEIKNLSVSVSFKDWLKVYFDIKRR